MEIIETIPIYKVPDWPAFVLLAGLVISVIGGMIASNREPVFTIIICICLVTILFGLASFLIIGKSEFSHNEYIMRLSDMPAQEFIERYEVTKTFEYSDVIQVREIEK